MIEALLIAYTSIGGLVSGWTFARNRALGERYSTLTVVVSTALITTAWPAVLTWAWRDAGRV